MIGPESLSGELGPTVLGRPDIDRLHLADASQAVQTAEQARPNMVILDLPRNDAVGVVRRLRDNPVTRPAAIVWLNRSDPPDVESELVSGGVNAVVPVPVDPLLWDRRLEELLSVPPRRISRIQVRLRDWSHFMKGTDEADGTILNIGARGVLLETSRSLELGGKIGMTFRLPGESTDLASVGQVVRIAEGEQGLRRVGVEFLIFRGDARDHIVSFVEDNSEPDRPGATTPELPLTVRPFEEAREWEEELRASELRKALILDSASDCILTVDHEGRILEFNTAARRTFGYSRSEVLGRVATEVVVPPALRDELRRRLRDFVTTGESADVGRRREATAMRADGSTFPVEVTVVPAYVKGRLLLTAYVKDLTDRDRARRLGEVRHRATHLLTEALSLAEAGPVLLGVLVEGMECEETRLWLSEGEPPSLVLAGTSATASGSRGERPDESVARDAVEQGEPVWVENLDRPSAGSAVAVPVRGGGQLLGVLEARYGESRPCSAEWLAALGDIASQLGLFLKRQRAEADLQRLARYDSLTGLPNRTFFLDTLERTLSRAAHRNTLAALVFLDLDGFKDVNDRLGHPAGDTVLQATADRLRAGTRSSDLVARMGGDEFTVLVQDLARPDDAALVARGLLERLVRPLAVVDEEVSLTASAGISVFPEDGGDALTLLRHADLAMYRAKQEGKNNYRFFISEMSDRAAERMALLDGLRVALERDEFELMYQPIVRRDGPPSLEALLRWRHPKLGVVAPEGFISQAEESGLILPIGTRVLKAATAFATSLPEDVRLVVNLSARQLLQPGLVGEMEAALQGSGLPASRLVIDVSEATVMTRSEDVRGRLRRLRDLGVEPALDDFGTGFFSIALIRELGFQQIKIDRSLVSGVPDHPEHAAQVEAILVLARSLGIEAVAEGVETGAERAFLAERGCSSLQGFLVSPPLEPAKAKAFIETHPRS
ncbi:MAG: EAL domain-containing protein [Acidobacteria bacterium]|nr:EAL domain-containing protein [Acidobacteriota bacterium]